MYNNNTIKTATKTLSPLGWKDEKLVESYQKLVDDFDDVDNEYEDITVEESTAFAKRIEEEYYYRNPDDLAIFEDTKFANSHWSVSPYAWIQGIPVLNVFAPLKWLAMLTLGGLGLLLVLLWKLIGMGMTQLAIKRVRDWIHRLVVIADGGYKKKKKSKDSLFLIEARARRDILQAAVMAGYSTGINIPKKTNEPKNPIESAKNESVEIEYSWNPFTEKISQKMHLFENDGIDKQILNQIAYVEFEGKKYTPQQFKNLDPNLDPSKLVVYQNLNGNVSKAGSSVGLWNIIKDYIEHLDNQPKDAVGMDNTPEVLLNQIKNEQNGDVDITEKDDLRFSPEKIDFFTIGEAKEPQYKINNESISKFFEDITRDANLLGHGHSISNIPIQIHLTDQSVLSSDERDNFQQWLSDKYKIYCKQNREDVIKTLNQGYDVKELDTLLPDDSRVDWSLMNTLVASRFFGLVKHKTNLWAEAQSCAKIRLDQITTEADRQKYVTNLITNVNASLNKIMTPTIARNYTNVINKFVQEIQMRKTSKDELQNTGQASSTGSLQVGNHGSSESLEYLPQNALNEAVNNKITIEMSPEEWERYRTGNSNSQMDIDSTRHLVDNCYKIIQQIMTMATPSDFLVVKKTSDQMKNFLDELTKTVNVIIDSVAKKVGKNGESSANPIVRFLSSDDSNPIQNRTLKNLWHNIARPQLDSRAITRCFEIPQTPEFDYFVEIMAKTIPYCILLAFAPDTEAAKKLVSLVQKDGTAFTGNALKIIHQNAEKVQKAKKQEAESKINDDMSQLFAKVEIGAEDRNSTAKIEDDKKSTNNAKP